MGFPRDYPGFTNWYLTKKKYISRADNADFTLTVDGVDFIETQRASVPLIHRLLTRGNQADDDQEAHDNTLTWPSPADSPAVVEVAAVAKPVSLWRAACTEPAQSRPSSVRPPESPPTARFAHLTSHDPEGPVPVATTEVQPEAPRWWQTHSRTERWLVAAGFVIVTMAAIGLPLVNKFWPYRYRNVKPLLEQVFASKVTIGHYNRIYFPHPGFVAEDLTMRRNTSPGLPPIGSAQELKVEGNWLDLLLLQRRVRLVEVKGLHVLIPPPGTPANQQDFPPGSSADFAGPSTTVQTMHMQDAKLDIMKEDGGRLSYPIHDLALHGVRTGQAVNYVVDMQNAQPTGRIQAHGSFGPITPSNLGGTPLSGDFVFAPVNLGDIGILHGTLSGKGHFDGRLADIETRFTVEVPDFAVGNGHPAAVSGAAQCTLNGLNSDVVLHTIEVRTGMTVIHAGGAVVGSPKVTDIQMHLIKGRVEDLLGPFLHDRVPVTGVVWLSSKTHVAPDRHGEKFLRRLTLQGSFDLPAEKLTDRATEQSLTAFGARAQGASSGKDQPGDPARAAADVVSSLKGQAIVRNGILSTDQLTFEMPGASANLKGTYAFHGGAVHLIGHLKMDSDISHAATGFKSVLLKPLAPFFKRKQAGAVVEIAVTGTPHHYAVAQDVLHNK